ncbi:8956_t:CDS:2 [Diversispora eburnea]|uniref:8956_t:CDS:1 n=1 Tax=Diversispora eburnea TaxID=1213867 RepID=A0A9N8WIY4_9GLOM|nr:8956_t:CDS:2 [Diversispora eburnea]
MPADRAMSRNQPPKQQRKKRIQIADQNPQPQQPRQSVFERLGTKNSGTALIPRPAKTKKEIKDISSNNGNKVRRVSDSRQAERELSEGELTQDTGKAKDRQSAEVRPKLEGKDSKNMSEFINSENLDTENLKESVNNISKEMKIQDQDVHDGFEGAGNVELQKLRSTSFSDTATLPATNEHYEESEDAAKEDVVSILADDDFILPSDYEDYQEYQENYFLSDLGQVTKNNESNREHLTRTDTQQNDLIHDRDKNRDKELTRIRENDLNKDASSFRNSERDRSFDRANREVPMIQPHKDDRRRIREVRERQREERYNRAIASERRERERQERYNQSIIEDKSHLEIPRRDRLTLDHERGRGSHGSHTPTADTSSNSTIRGGVSRSPSISDREKTVKSQNHPNENSKREDTLKDRPLENPREREYNSVSRQRDELSKARDSPRDREQKSHEDTKDKETSSKIYERDPTAIRKVDEKEPTFRRLDERPYTANRRPDEYRPAPPAPERIIRDLNRDRDKDSHYQREASERLRPSSIRPKEPLNDPSYQDRDSRQRNAQPIAIASEQRGDALSSNQRPPDYRIRDKERDIRQRDEFQSKEAIRVGRDERPLHERTSVLPDFYRPSSEHHIRDPDRRPIREFERDYRERDIRSEIPGIDRYRTEYNQGRPDNAIERHPRELEQRQSWDERENREKDYRGPGTFIDKDLIDHRRDRDRERTRDGEFRSRSNSADSHKQSYDRHHDPERRMSRNLEIEQMNRTNKLESVRRSDTERNPSSAGEKQRDANREFSQEIRTRDEKSINIHDRQLKESNTDLILPKEDDIPPYPWKKCISSKNKVYYFNAETRESRWTFPNEDNGKKSNVDIGNVRQIMTEQTESGINTDFESLNKDDNDGADTPRKKPRLNAEDESTERSLSDDRKDTNNERILDIVEQNTTNNTSNRDLPLRTRSGTLSNVATSPTTKSQPPYPDGPQFLPTMRSPSSQFNDRRYSSDYDLSSGTIRRGISYSGSQLQSPSSSLRANAIPFNRVMPEFYDRNDFRHDDFNSPSRGPSGIVDPRNMNMIPQVASQLSANNRPSRSSMFVSNHSYGIEQSSVPVPGIRRMSSAGRGGGNSGGSFQLSQYRRRSSFEEDRNPYNEASMDLLTDDGGNGQLIQNSDEILAPIDIGLNSSESDEEAWRTEDELIDYRLSDIELESLFCHRSVPQSPVSKTLTDDEIIRHQISPVWNHITSSVAGDELFQQFEQIMNSNNNSRKRKREMKTVNSRKEFEQRRALYGGRRMFRHLPKTTYPDYFVYPKLSPEMPDELIQLCIDIYQCHSENPTETTIPIDDEIVVLEVDSKNNTENELNQFTNNGSIGRIDDVVDDPVEEIPMVEDEKVDEII